MKKVLAIIVIAITACNNIKVTTSPDNHTATSGTLGSATFTNKLPEIPDTTRRVDTLKITKDTLR